MILDASETLDDLRVPPGNRLEKLKGDRKRQYSIRVNDQWRSLNGRVAMHLMRKLRITTRNEIMSRKKMSLIHPGEILLLEFLEPLGISQYRLAKDISVPPRRINEIIKGTRSITANTALRLAKYFATSERFWLNLQSHYDLERERDRLGTSLGTEVQTFASAN